MATVHASESFANKLHDAVNLGLDVFEADVRERVAVLINIDSSFQIGFIIIRLLKKSLEIIQNFLLP